jgi:nucleoid-associated protein YgaU
VEWLDATVDWPGPEPPERAVAVAAAEPTEEAEAAAADSTEPPESATAKADQPRRHTVGRGDTLSEIAKEYLGSGSRAAVRRLMAANPWLKDPNVVPLGSVLIIPGPEDEAVATTSQRQTTPTTRIHKVQPNDTLARLAKRFLGSERAWRRIYELNRSTIKNPNVLLVGQTLQIPVAAAAGSSRS